MKPEDMISALNDIDDELILNAKSAGHTAPSFCWGRLAAVLAACLCFAVLAGAVLFSGGSSISAYAYESHLELTRNDAVIDTGLIRDTGEMIGQPLMFYLDGQEMERVRFSCEKGQLEFIDWTEQREEYGAAQNITVPYGKHREEYPLMTISWIPAHITDRLTCSSKCSIAELPGDVKQDRIVLEITLANQKTVTKAIFIRLCDDGTVTAAYDDYRITDADTFVRRKDAEPLSAGNGDSIHEGIEGAEKNKIPALAADAEQAARSYYDHTVFTVEAMEVISCSEQSIVFDVCVSKKGVVQEPNRSITLTLSDGVWKVTNEGY